MIIEGDCLEVMKTFEDNQFDLVLTDPPYGINADRGVGGFGSSAHTARKYDDDWDSIRPTKEYFDELLRVGRQAIIWGGSSLLICYRRMDTGLFGTKLAR